MVDNAAEGLQKVGEPELNITELSDKAMPKYTTHSILFCVLHLCIWQYLGIILYIIYVLGLH